MARDIELKLVGRDVGASRVMRKVARELDKTAENATKADKKLAEVGKRLAKAGALNVGKVGASIAAIASSTGPAVVGLLAVGKAIAAIGAGAAKVAPLAALLPSIAASAALVIGTIRLAGPAIGRALSPIGQRFKSMEGEIGRLASRGLPRLAAEFNRVNFPTIARGMREIARDVNLVVVGIGQWINSRSGQQAIREVVEATADATEKLDGRVVRLGVAFGEMIKRVGRAGIDKVANLLVRLSEAGIRWLNSIDKSDVDGAFKALGGWGTKLRDTFTALRDIGQWMAENEEAVKRFSDIAAGTAIALGAATGNWVAVIVGAGSIAINHWDELKKAGAETGRSLSQTYRTMAEDPNLKALSTSMNSAFKGFRDSLSKSTDEMGPKWTRFVGALKLAWEEWAPILTAWWEGVGKPIMSAAGKSLGFWAEHVVTSMTVTAHWLRIGGQAFKLLWEFVSRYLGQIINAAAAAFGWVPGIGPMLIKAASDFNSFRDRVNNALAGIDTDITINIKTRGTPGVTGSNEQFNVRVGRRAKGGPVEAGRPYMVGERGMPELFVPNANGRIFTEAPSRDRAPVGHAEPLALTIQSGGTSLDDLLVEILRRAIRHRGGNVQTVLGR